MPKPQPQLPSTARAGQLNTATSPLKNTGVLKNPTDVTQVNAGIPVAAAAPIARPVPTPEDLFQKPKTKTPRPTTGNAKKTADYPARTGEGVVYPTYQPARPSASPAGQHPSTHSLTPGGHSQTPPEPQAHAQYARDLEQIAKGEAIASHTVYGTHPNLTTRALTTPEIQRIAAHSKAGCAQCRGFLAGFNAGARGRQARVDRERAEAETQARFQQMAAPRQPNESADQFIARVAMARGFKDLHNQGR